MKNIIFIAFVFYIIFVFACHNSKNLNETFHENNNIFFNLDFEFVNRLNIPRNWNVGGKGYEILIDSSVSYSGRKSLAISQISIGKFGVATSTFPIEAARGKHIIFSGYIKTEDINNGYAGLWWRVDGAEGILAFDNMHDRGPSGTTEWTQYDIEIVVSEEAKNINFGVLLSGDGTAWFDNLSIAVNGEAYEQTIPKPYMPSNEELRWLKENIIALETAEPDSNLNDLTPLKSLLGDAEIISLGEGTHGTSEFFKMKHRIVRYLAEEFGDVVFAIEANMPEARRVNDYVLFGKGNPKEAIAGMYFWTWNTQEVLDMIKWMRNYNVLGRGKIEFWGFDMQYPNVAIDNVTDFIMKTDITYSDSLRLLYNIVSASSEEMKRLFPDKRKGKAGRWYNAAFQVFNHLLTNRSNYLKSYDTLTVEQIIQDSRIVVQGAEIYVEGKRSRDECMAANVEWVREHIAKKNKLVLWAHNGHVSKLRHRMGDYLNQKYGGEMIVFGFAFYTGRYTAVGDNGLGIYSTSLPEPGSIEQILHNTAIEEMLIDLRNANNSHKTDWLSKKLEFRSIGAKAMDYAFYPTVITNEFDVLIYFDKTTPSKLLDKRVK